MKHHPILTPLFQALVPLTFAFANHPACAGTISLPVHADAYAISADNFASVATTQASPSTYQVALFGTNEARAAMEFDLSGVLLPGEKILSASLVLQVTESDALVGVHAGTGNGTIEDADFTFDSQITVFDPDSSVLPQTENVVDVTSFVSGAAGGGYVVFQLRELFDQELNIIFGSGVASPQLRPQLRIVTGPAEILHWPIEEGSGSVTTELVSGQTSVATLVGGPAWTSGIAPTSSSALDFQNTDPANYIDAGTLDILGNYVAGSPVNSTQLGNAWTVTAWIKPDASANLGGNDNCIITSDTTEANWWLFGVRNNKLFFDFNSGRTFGPSIQAGQAYFVAISADTSGAGFLPGNKHRFSVWDGHSWTTLEGSSYANIRMLGLEIGSFASGIRQFDGDIDEVRIFNQALTPAELSSLALNNASGGDLGVTVTAPTGLQNSMSLVFKVQFTEDVADFAASDLVVTSDPGLFTLPPSVIGSGNTYTVTVPAQGDGQVSVDVIPGAGVTAGGNPLINHVASAPVTVDQTPPTITGFTVVGINPTPASTVRVNFDFSEPITGFNDTDFIVNHSGTSHSGSFTGGTNAQTNYIILNNVSGDGSFTITIPGPGNSVEDLAGNQLAAFTSPQIFHYTDNDAPYVVSITPNTTTPDSGGDLILTVVFSEPVIQIGSPAVLASGSNFSFSGSTSANSSDGITWTFTNFRVGIADGETSAAVSFTTNPTSFTDIAGNPLITPNPASDPITFPASTYQLWAIGKNLTAGVNFSFYIDADGDGGTNGEEFMRDGEPLTFGDPVKRRMHIANVAGQDYGVLTFAAPDGADYGNSEPGIIFGEYDDETYLYVLDIFTSSVDLEEFENGDASFDEDPSIATPPDMPMLSPGWSYRHLRFNDPVGVLPKAFLMNEVYFDL